MREAVQERLGDVQMAQRLWRKGAIAVHHRAMQRPQRMYRLQPGEPSRQKSSVRVGMCRIWKGEHCPARSGWLLAEVSTCIKRQRLGTPEVALREHHHGERVETTSHNQGFCATLNPRKLAQVGRKRLVEPRWRSPFGLPPHELHEHEGPEQRHQEEHQSDEAGWQCRPKEVRLASFLGRGGSPRIPARHAR